MVAVIVYFEGQDDPPGTHKFVSIPRPGDHVSLPPRARKFEVVETRVYHIGFHSDDLICEPLARAFIRVRGLVDA